MKSIAKARKRGTFPEPKMVGFRSSLWWSREAVDEFYLPRQIEGPADPQMKIYYQRNNSLY